MPWGARSLSNLLGNILHQIMKRPRKKKFGRADFWREKNADRAASF